MRILLVSHGTRGDVQPFVSIAHSLMARGHDVKLMVPPNLVEWVARCGVKPGQIAIDSQAFMESPEGRAWLASGDVASFTRRMGAITHAHVEELIADYLRESAEAELLVANMLTEDWVINLAEARGLPFMALHLAPLRATDAFPHPLATVRPLPFKFLSRLTHRLVESMWWKGFAVDVNVFRGRLELAPVRTPTPQRLRSAGFSTVHAFSPSLVPQPADWGPTQPVMGMIRFPDAIRARLGEAEPPEALAAWLAAGPPPIFLGLGSMPVEDPAAMIGMVDRVTRALGLRAIIGAGWSRLDLAQTLPDHLHIVGAVDHNWLFPRCQAIVHHGGAGTLHASLGAGRPTVVCSVFADQPFWGARVEALGVGAHVPFAKLTEARLAAALRRALTPETLAAAARLGEAILAEPDATPAIVERIEALAGGASRVLSA